MNDSIYFRFIFVTKKISTVGSPINQVSLTARLSTSAFDDNINTGGIASPCALDQHNNVSDPSALLTAVPARITPFATIDFAGLPPFSP